MTPDERTRRDREAVLQIQSFPLQYGTGTASPPFHGEWTHTAPAEVIREIRANGWRPELLKNTIYGTAVYLSRKPWSIGDETSSEKRDSLRVQLQLDTSDVQSAFAFEFPMELAAGAACADKRGIWTDGLFRGEGSDETAVLWYFKTHRLCATAGRGGSRQNLAIRDHFLHRGVKAIQFSERNILVVAVYDPTCIRVLSDIG